MENFGMRTMPVPIKKRSEEKIYAAENKTIWRGWTTADGQHKGNTQFQKDDAVFCGYDAPFWPGAFALRESQGRRRNPQLGAKRMSAWRKGDKTGVLSDSGRKLCIPLLFCYTVSDRIPPGLQK